MKEGMKNPEDIFFVGLFGLFFLLLLVMDLENAIAHGTFLAMLWAIVSAVLISLFAMLAIVVLSLGKIYKLAKRMVYGSCLVSKEVDNAS